ncbi:hypothetical protein D5Q56_23850 [Vibrio parahaemolyticus]|nr:hypothetical protein [Vibrio parahaemolyticus]
MDRLIFRAEFQPIKWLLKQINPKRFEPKKITTNQPENPMRQPANICMFYRSSDSRIWGDKAELPKNQIELPEKKKRLEPRIFLLRLTPH